MTEPGFASPSAILADALSAFLPPTRQTVAEHAAEHRLLHNTGGGYVGPYRHELAPYLREPMEQLTNRDVQTIAISGPGQSGKALAISTPIPTPSGWTTMGDIAVGDQVFDADGNICSVTFATPVMFGHACYVVRFSDGSEIVADDEHLWAVQRHSRPRRKDGSRYHVWDHREVVTTGTLALKVVDRAEGMHRFAVRVAGPISTPQVDLPIDPYVLGAWVGDGQTAGGRIFIHRRDDEIRQRIESAGYKLEAARERDELVTFNVRVPGWDLNYCTRGHDLRIVGFYTDGACTECGRQNSLLYQRGIPRKDAPRPRDTFRRRLACLGVLGNKHIPATYLRASADQRWALLRGLMDTDGTIGQGGRASYTSTIERLALDVAELARTLGFKPTIRRRIPTCVMGERRVQGAAAYQVEFTAYAETPVFGLRRKIARQRSRVGRRTTETERRRIVAVDAVPTVPVRCIQVDSESRLYLAGAGFVPTHNTTIAENWLLYSVDVDPGNLLWYMQTDDAVEAYVKGTINPMVDGHDELRNKLGLRPVDDSLHFKRFRAMYVEFLSATLKTLINKKAPRLVADEIDAYPAGLGDVKALLDVRRQTFGRASKLLMLSHPDQARGVNPETDWTAGIMAVYADSTRCTWWWPCPHCGAWSSPNPTAARVTTIDYPVDGSLDEIQAAARLLCPVNGCLIEDHLRREMNSHARWVGAGQEITEGGDVTGERIRHPVAGYWIVGAMSPFVMGGIGGLARARVKAERELEVSGEDGTLRQVIVKQWGIPYSPQRGASSVDAATLVERCEPTLALARVPLGVRFLTVSADIQIAHFEWLVRGWGVNGESWVIDRGRLPADPATSPSDWDKLLAEVFLRAYELADGSGRVMAIRGAGFDTGGAPGVTQQAYAAWTRWRRTRLRLQDGRVGSPVRGYGKISGRDVFSIQGLKGNSKPNASKLSVTYPDTARKANAVAGRGIVPVGMFNANLFKDDLGGQLQQGQSGDWYVHFPAALKSKDPPHVFFEQLVSEVPDKMGRWSKINPNARNEALDLMVMSHVVAYLNGLTRIDWEKPPSWAAPWDENSLVVSSTPTPAPAPPAPTGGVTVTTQAPAAPEARRSILKKLAS